MNYLIEGVILKELLMEISGAIEWYYYQGLLYSGGSNVCFLM